MVIFWVGLELFCPAKNLIEHGFRPSVDSQWEISLGARLCFASGAVGEAVYVSLFNTFITIYYNQAIGLSNALIGTAIMLAMLGDAITDPIVGIISDRWRSRYGRIALLYLLPAPPPVS